MITEAQARLDDKIAALIQALYDCRAQRNALSPISRLPTEILASVFIHCACASYKQYPSSPRVPDWVNVSYVCRRWRDVALNCPTLWSFLFVSSERWTDELLVRSKTAPLKLCMNLYQPKSSVVLHLLDKVALRMHHIQDLRLSFSREEAKIVQSFFSGSGPFLEDLPTPLPMSIYNDFFRATAPLFHGDTPALHTLELMHCPVPFKFGPLRALTFLRLRKFYGSSQPTLAELKVALSHMQDLVHLHLEDALPSARDDSTGLSFEDSEKLSFPRLSRLSIVAPFSTVLLLLSCFDIPIQTEVRLRCRKEQGTDYTSIYPLLARRFVSWNQGSAPVQIIRTCVIKAGLTVASFIFSTAERDCDRHVFSSLDDLDMLCEDWDCNIPLKLDVELQRSLQMGIEDLVTGICQNVCLTNLQSVRLTLYSECTLSLAFWMNSFGHLEELVHISIRLSHMAPAEQGLDQVLSLAPHPHHLLTNEGKTSGLHGFAPALEELELIGVGFSEKYHGRPCSDPNKCSFGVARLYDVLSARKAEGHGLQWLILEDCRSVCREDVEALRAVTNVDFKGWFEVDEDEDDDGDDDMGEVSDDMDEVGGGMDEVGNDTDEDVDEFPE